MPRSTTGGQLRDVEQCDGTLEGAAVDELKRRVRELERALADAERRNEAWLSIVSHDLRGPLTLVMGYAENLLHNTRPTNENAQSIRELDAIVAAARRLNKMVAQVVDGARIEGRRLPLRIRPTDLGPLVQARIRAASRTYPTHQFRSDLATSLPLVRGDARAIETIVGALVSNAAVFSPPGSTVDVVTRPVEGWVGLSVVDRGVGFAEDELDRAFEPRFRPDRTRDARREGLGVSLWIARSLAELLGGSLTVKSPGLNQGTIATFQLSTLGDYPSSSSSPGIAD
jgi:signal transduction histidine kinase